MQEMIQAAGRVQAAAVSHKGGLTSSGEVLQRGGLRSGPLSRGHPQVPGEDARWTPAESSGIARAKRRTALG